MERKAASVFPIFQLSNFFARGKSINEISKATLNGMRMDLARTNMANSAKTVAIA
jgi:hypothetical protein